jgi:hypothetical protein
MLSRLLCLALLLTTFVSRASAWDLSGGRSATRFHLWSAPTSGSLAPSLMLDSHRAALSAALASAESMPSALAIERKPQRDLDVRKSMARAGYATAVSLGLTFGGLTMAAQTRPRTGEQPGIGVCTEDPEGERTMLYASSGAMAVGVTVSSVTISHLVALRRAHPHVRPRVGTRVAQGVIGAMSAASTYVFLWGATAICMAS